MRDSGDSAAREQDLSLKAYMVKTKSVRSFQMVLGFIEKG